MEGGGGGPEIELQQTTAPEATSETLDEAPVIPVVKKAITTPGSYIKGGLLEILKKVGGTVARESFINAPRAAVGLEPTAGRKTIPVAEKPLTPPMDDALLKSLKIEDRVEQPVEPADTAPTPEQLGTLSTPPTTSEGTEPTPLTPGLNPPTTKAA